MRYARFPFSQHSKKTGHHPKVWVAFSSFDTWQPIALSAGSCNVNGSIPPYLNCCRNALMFACIARSLATRSRSAPMSESPKAALPFAVTG